MDPRLQFRLCLVEKKLKVTRQRLEVLDAFLKAGQHLSTEDLYLQIRATNPRIGYATVYRTLKLLAECGIAAARNFGDGQTRYEPTQADEHHDHLICTACGRIVEFEDAQLELLKEEVASRHGFRMQRHRLDLYGLCPDCQ